MSVNQVASSFILIAAWLMVGMTVAGCASEDEAAPVVEEDAAYYMNPATLAEGDTLLGLRVRSLDVEQVSIGWVGEVQFEGEVEIAGHYGPHVEYPEPDLLCFFPDEESARRLPRFQVDTRTSWFCFENQEEARVALARPPAEGPARIVIDDYRYIYMMTDVYNTAYVERVLESEGRAQRFSDLGENTLLAGGIVK